MDSDYELGLKVALQRFDEEADRREVLDGKASMILGFAGILMGLILSSMSVKGPFVSTKLPVILPLMLSSGALLSAILFSLRALWIRDYRTGPGNKILIHESEIREESQLRRELFVVYANAFQHNWKQNQQKARFLRASFLAITIGTALVFVTVSLLILM